MGYFKKKLYVLSASKLTAYLIRSTVSELEKLFLQRKRNTYGIFMSLIVMQVILFLKIGCCSLSSARNGEVSDKHITLLPASL